MNKYKIIKGESSFWINKNKLAKQKFAWQNEYLAVGVGDEKLKIMRNYIAEQEDRHNRASFIRNMTNLLNDMALI